MNSVCSSSSHFLVSPGLFKRWILPENVAECVQNTRKLEKNVVRSTYLKLGRDAQNQSKALETRVFRERSSDDDELERESKNVSLSPAPPFILAVQRPRGAREME